MVLNDWMRRGLDILISTLVLVLFLPVGWVIAMLVRWDSPGPVFYRARRVGKDGHLFTLYKFRTMVADADRRGPAVTRGNDPRITRVGRWLRRTKLDEWPQFWNVLKGDMSLVGPRPEDPHYVEYYTPEQWEILRVRPGLISPATLKYRDEEEVLEMLTREGEALERVYLKKVLTEKLQIDGEYLRRRTLWTDWALLAQAVAAVFSIPLAPHSRKRSSCGRP